MWNCVEPFVVFDDCFFMLNSNSIEKSCGRWRIDAIQFLHLCFSISLSQFSISFDLILLHFCGEHQSFGSRFVSYVCYHSDGCVVMKIVRIKSYYMTIDHTHKARKIRSTHFFPNDKSSGISSVSFFFRMPSFKRVKKKIRSERKEKWMKIECRQLEGRKQYFRYFCGLGQDLGRSHSRFLPSWKVHKEFFFCCEHFFLYISVRHFCVSVCGREMGRMVIFVWDARQINHC